MDWLDEVKRLLQKKNQILFARDYEYLRDLAALFQEQNHRTMALWVFDFSAGSILALEKKYPDEKRPGEALEAARRWAAGEIKMRPAQQKILACHAFAKEIACKEDIAMCHAVGQACAVVHTAKHAIGYPIYDLTSIVYRLGTENCSKAVELRKQEYLDKLFYWKEHLPDYQAGWADFMLK